MAAINQYAERDAFLWMQGRLIELLLRHETPRFDKTFAERIAEGLDDPRLRRYRELAVVFYLRDELFNSILPRIKRRLSFVAPRQRRTESLPARGRIDWPRTMEASFRTLPGEPPVQVQTRQRRRHFATPENLFTVAILLEYQATAQRFLDSEMAHDYAQALRHPLHGIVHACGRELVFPQFASLVPEASAIVEQRTRQLIADLEAQVADNLLPGRNSAYNDLLVWREKLVTLHLLERRSELAVQTMLGADPEEADYLYQIWLFYEIADLLQRRGRLLAWNPDDPAVTYTWGAADDQREYRLRHDRIIRHHRGVGRTRSGLPERDRATHRSAEPGQSLVQAGAQARQAAGDQLSRAATHNRLAADHERLRSEHGVLHRRARLGGVHGGGL